MTEISYQCRQCKHMWRTTEFVTACPSCGIRFGGDAPTFATAHHPSGVEETIRPFWSIEYKGHTVTCQLDAEMPTWAVLYCQQLFAEQMPLHAEAWHEQDPSEHMAALGRHFERVSRGEVVDQDSGRLALAHIALRALMLLECAAAKLGQDNPIKPGEN